MNVPALSAVSLVLLYVALSVNVSRVRWRRRKHPQVDEDALEKAVRAHGNAAEYVPLLVATLLYLSYAPQHIVLDAVAVLAVISRVAHAVGMLRASRAGAAHPLRSLGALGTYLCLFAIAAAMLRRIL